MKGSDPALSVANSVNHDVASRRNSGGGRAINIPLLRIRDMQGAMVVAVLFMEVDQINSFRRALIAFLLLRPHRRAA